MASDDASVQVASCSGGRHGFPTLRVRGPVAFIGLSSACASPPLMATGRVGRRQRVAFAELLTETAARGLFRVSLLYLPILLLVLALDGRAVPDAEPVDTPTLTVGGAPIGG